MRVTNGAAGSSAHPKRGALRANNHQTGGGNYRFEISDDLLNPPPESSSDEEQDPTYTPTAQLRNGRAGTPASSVSLHSSVRTRQSAYSEQQSRASTSGSQRSLRRRREVPYTGDEPHPYGLEKRGGVVILQSPKSPSPGRKLRGVVEQVVHRRETRSEYHHNSHQSSQQTLSAAQSHEQLFSDDETEEDSHRRSRTATARFSFGQVTDLVGAAGGKVHSGVMRMCSYIYLFLVNLFLFEKWCLHVKRREENHVGLDGSSSALGGMYQRQDGGYRREGSAYRTTATGGNYGKEVTEERTARSSSLWGRWSGRSEESLEQMNSSTASVETTGSGGGKTGWWWNDNKNAEGMEIRGDGGGWWWNRSSTGAESAEAEGRERRWWNRISTSADATEAEGRGGGGRWWNRSSTGADSVEAEGTGGGGGRWWNRISTSSDATEAEGRGGRWWNGSRRSAEGTESRGGGGGWWNGSSASAEGIERRAGGGGWWKSSSTSAEGIERSEGGGGGGWWNGSDFLASLNEMVEQGWTLFKILLRLALVIFLVFLFYNYGSAFLALAAQRLDKLVSSRPNTAPVLPPPVPVPVPVPATPKEPEISRQQIQLEFNAISEQMGKMKEGLKLDMGALESELHVYNTRIATLETAFAEKEDPTPELKAEIDKLAALMATLRDEISVLNTRIQALELAAAAAAAAAAAKPEPLPPPPPPPVEVDMDKLKQEILPILTQEISARVAISCETRNCPEVVVAAPPPPPPSPPATMKVVGGLSKEQIERMIKDAIALYDADKTGLPDLALESAGGSILSTRCTKSSDLRNSVISYWGFRLWSPPNTPRTIIQPGVVPGECWAFEGSVGDVVIKLAVPSRVDGFTMEHIPKTVSRYGHIDSAPKHFQVLGLQSEHDTETVHDYGSFTYEDNNVPLQYFPVVNASSTFYPIVELKILSNHGNLRHTCLYRFRVHGEIDLTRSQNGGASLHIKLPPTEAPLDAAKQHSN